jgi:hypothetical protein
MEQLWLITFPLLFLPCKGGLSFGRVALIGHLSHLRWLNPMFKRAFGMSILVRTWQLWISFLCNQKVSSIPKYNWTPKFERKLVWYTSHDVLVDKVMNMLSYFSIASKHFKFIWKFVTLWVMSRVMYEVVVLIWGIPHSTIMCPLDTQEFSCHTSI